MVVKFEVDLNEPLVSQVGYLGEAYDEWVHQPIVTKEGPRFFANDIMEMVGDSAGVATSCVLACLHFYAEGPYPCSSSNCISIWANTFHYLLHGCHHKHPMDALRLVFPPAATAILCVPFWTIIRLLSTASVAPALFGGLLLGYVMYDTTHYYLHHGQPFTGFPKKLKKYHLNHHFRAQTKGFGITSSLWDHVFGTYPHPKVV